MREQTIEDIQKTFAGRMRKAAGFVEEGERAAATVRS